MKQARRPNDSSTTTLLRVWTLSQAKARLGVVIDMAAEGPQVITRRGNEVAVVLSRSDYAALQGDQTGLVEFFRRSPLVGVELEILRDRNTARQPL